MALRSLLLGRHLGLWVGSYTAGAVTVLSAQPASPARPVALPAERYSVPASNEGLPGAGAVRRDEPFQRSLQEQRAAWIKFADCDRGAVVFVGDAAFAGWSGLSSAFPGMKVANRAVEGVTTRGVLIRLNEDVISLHPSAVVLLIGSNDVEAGVSPEIAADNVTLIVEALQQHWPTMPIVVCQALAGLNQTNRPPQQIQALNTAILQAVLNRPGVTYLETSTLWADQPGNARPDEIRGGIQLNEGAYGKLASALRPVLSTLGLLSEEADDFQPEPGFISLFNGRDLSGWGYRPVPDNEIQAARRRDASNPRAPVRVYPGEAAVFNGATSTPDGRYIAKGGRLVVTTPPEYRKIQQLWTEREFAEDFVLKLEFRATPNTDSGVYIRGPQLQVRDYLVAGPYKQLKHYRPQDWNELVITVRGEVAVCTCNGEVIEAAFKVPAKGPIGLEGDRGQMEFRRIRISVTPQRGGA